MVVLCMVMMIKQEVLLLLLLLLHQQTLDLTAGAAVRTMTEWPKTMNHNRWLPSELHPCIAAFSASSLTNSENCQWNEMQECGGNDRQNSSLWAEHRRDTDRVWSSALHPDASCLRRVCVTSVKKARCPCWMIVTPLCVHSIQLRGVKALVLSSLDLYGDGKKKKKKLVGTETF